MTKFVVLARQRSPRDEGWLGWLTHSEQEAHNAEAAIRAAYMKDSEGVLEMVAIPARSWKPQPIRTETSTRVVLGSTEQTPATPDPPPQSGSAPTEKESA